MTAKRKGLFERIKEAQSNEPSIANKFDIIKSKKQTPDKAGSSIVDPEWTQGGPSIDTVSPLGPVKVQSGSGPGPVSSIGPRSSLGPVSSISQSDLCLAPKQQQVYEWFLRNGFEGYFNKGIISRKTHISHPTVKKSISKLKSLSLIFIGVYDPVSRQQKYSLNTELNVKLLTGSGLGLVSSQGLVSGLGQVQSGSTSYKTERKILNNLSVYIQNSDFWKAQGLTLRKCENWIDKIEHCDSDFLLQQLQFGEAEPKVKNANSPIDYFFKSISKDGLTRPNGFEFPDEKRLRIQQEEIKRREDLLKHQEEIRKEEQDLADREAFLMFLNDKDAVDSAVRDIKKQAVTPKMKIAIKNYSTNGKIDSRLEGALKRIFTAN